MSLGIARRIGYVLALAGISIAAAGGCNYLDPQHDAASACALYALNTCQTLARCGSTSDPLQVCQAELQSTCQDSLQQPDVLSTSGAVRVCADAMGTLSCMDLYNRELPPSCATPRGKRNEGAACSASAQCAGGRCVGAQAGVWGRCRELRAADETCASFADCQDGLVCNAASRCVALAAAGAPCGPLAPCRSPLACEQGRCAAPQPGPSAGCAAVSCMPEPLAAANACQQLAQQLCARLTACAPAVVARVYGDMASCAARNDASCLARQQTPDVVSSAAGLTACAQQLPDIDCSALLDNALPAACQLGPGTRAVGLACSDDAQCASTRCARMRDASCGVCQALAEVEQPCNTASDCASGLVCTSDLMCRRPVALDASCDAQHPCAFPLTCAAGRCSTALTLASACDTASDRCDRYAGLFCEAVSARCSSWLQARPGEACGYTQAGWAECGASGVCRTPSGASAGTCDGALADGASCVAGSSPGCLTPARCVAGVCRLPAPGDCAS